MCGFNCLTVEHYNVGYSKTTFILVKQTRFVVLAGVQGILHLAVWV